MMASVDWDNVSIQMSGVSGNLWLVGNDPINGGVSHRFVFYDWLNSAERFVIEDTGGITCDNGAISTDGIGNLGAATIRCGAMPTADPADGTNTLWVDVTGIVHLGT